MSRSLQPILNEYIDDVSSYLQDKFVKIILYGSYARGAFLIRGVRALRTA